MKGSALDKVLRRKQSGAQGPGRRKLRAKTSLFGILGVGCNVMK